MSKEIEAGCNAVIVNDKIGRSANGIKVKVVGRDPDPFWSDRFWLVKSDTDLGEYGLRDCCIPTAQLQRID